MVSIFFTGIFNNGARFGVLPRYAHHRLRAVAIVKELPGVSKSIRRWPLIISIRSLAIPTDLNLRRFSRYGKTDRDSYDV